MVDHASFNNLAAEGTLSQPMIDAPAGAKLFGGCRVRLRWWRCSNYRLEALILSLIIHRGYPCDTCRGKDCQHCQGTRSAGCLVVAPGSAAHREMTARPVTPRSVDVSAEPSRHACHVDRKPAVWIHRRSCSSRLLLVMGTNRPWTPLLSLVPSSSEMVPRHRATPQSTGS